MNKKKIKELNPGDIFLDSFGLPLIVEKTEQLPFLNIPRTQPKTRLQIKTEKGYIFLWNFRSDQIVEVV